MDRSVVAKELAAATILTPGLLIYISDIKGSTPTKGSGCKRRIPKQVTTVLCQQHKKQFKTCL